ncbi:a von Willebrand factor type A domain protein [Candidatus Magnetomorum sp. HK-1]|nr:a von Willebrand factor type A domain protein [Candidatus Magnetomorum sp. HK-1]
MFNNLKYLFLTIFLIFAVLVASSHSAGLLTPKNFNIPKLDIKKHNVNVVIEDGYAITTVDQVFFNPNNQDLEAIYSFPVPDKAAVSEFTMWIDGKPINGEVLEKKDARQIYEEQKSNGNNAGLTEKNKYKTFEISVYPVLANQTTKIRLSYIQPAHVDTGIGRYVYPLEEGGVDQQALSFWTTNEVVSEEFTFDLLLKPAYPVEGVRLPNHPNAVVSESLGNWSVHIDNGISQATPNNGEEKALTINNQIYIPDEEDVEGQCNINSGSKGVFSLDTDIVVYYRHKDNLPGAVDLVTYKEPGAARGTFMLTLTPGMDLDVIQQGRDWVFVLDVSGSMEGKYATLAEGVSRALGNMNSNDRFRIVLFGDRARELTQGFVLANQQNIDEYSRKVSAINPNESTDLYSGLALGLKNLDSDRTSSLILVTDGEANVGVTDKKNFKLIKNYDVRVFTFIMGNSANRPLLKALTNASNGFALSVSNSDDIIGKIMLAQSKVNFESLHKAQINILGIKTADITPKNLGNVYRGQQLIIMGHYFGSGLAKVVLSGKISGQEKVYSTQFDFPDVSESNPEIERLWAYSTIEHLTQESFATFKIFLEKRRFLASTIFYTFLRCKKWMILERHQI